MSQQKSMPLPPGARRVALALSLLLALTAMAAPAGATSFRLPGISLEDLVNGTEDGFMSSNGKLTFSDFSADTSGIAPDRLKYYRLVPLGDGFRIFTPLVSFLGHHSGLDLGYTVTAAEGLLVDAVQITLLGGALFGRSKAEMDISSTGGDPLASLEVINKKFFFLGRKHDQSKLSQAVAELLVDERIAARTGLISGAFKLDHHFKTKPIPEPTTALLMGIGLVGLAIAGRPR